MKLLTILLLPFCIVLVGCETTGGTIGGLIPAPKFYQGKVENGIYYAKDGSFEVSVPAEQGSPAYTYMEVKEQYNDMGAYVSFNTSVRPNEVYRIEIGRKLDKSQKSPPFEQVVEGVLSNYKKQLKGFGTIPTEVWRTDTKLNGNNAVLAMLEQKIYSETAYHIIYIFESMNGGGVVWVQWPHSCESCLSGQESKVLAEHKRIDNFIGSFKLKI